MLDKPQIVQTEARLTAVIRLTISRSEIQSVMGPAINEVLAAIAAQGAAPAGPIFSYHFRRPTDTFDFEVGVPVTTRIVATGRVYQSQLPAVKTARTMYRGPYEGLGSAWGEFMEWIDTKGHKQAQDLWECYISGPESSPHPATWLTQLNRPLI